MFCPWQFQKTYFNLIPVKAMSLNDVASLNVKQNEVGRKKAIRSRAPIIPKMQRSNYQINIYCKLDTTNNVLFTINMPLLHQEAKDSMYANNSIAIPEAIKPSYNNLTHCNNKATLTCGLILT